MTKLQIGSPNLKELFAGEVCNIGFGAVRIELETCNIRINPTITVDNAAKLAAKTIYNAMRPEEFYTSEPEWLNKVTFASDKYESKPAVKIVDDKIWFNTPPFKKSKLNLNFWNLFTKYWYVMVVQAMQRALVGRNDRTVSEEEIINKYQGIDV